MPFHEAGSNLHPEEVLLPCLDVQLHARLRVVSTERVLTRIDLHRKITAIFHPRQLCIVAVDRRGERGTDKLLVAVNVHYCLLLATPLGRSGLRLLLRWDQTTGEGECTKS